MNNKSNRKMEGQGAGAASAQPSTRPVKTRSIAQMSGADEPKQLLSPKPLSSKRRPKLSQGLHFCPVQTAASGAALTAEVHLEMIPAKVAMLTEMCPVPR